MKAILIIDGNYILHKNVFTLHKHNKLFGELENQLTYNIEKHKKRFSFDRTFLVSDSRKSSWRKEIYNKYKENRKDKDDSIDWDYVYETYNEWKDDIKNEKIKELGYIDVIQSNNIEGDDFISALITIFNKKGYSCVVISSDKDLTQKCKFNKKIINIQMNDTYNNETLYLPEQFNIFLNTLDDNKVNVNSDSDDDSDDIFNIHSKTNFKEYLLKLIDTMDVKKINNNLVLCEKVIGGDKSDNIDSIYRKPVKNGQSFQNIGPATLTKIIDYYQEHFGTIDVYDVDFKANIQICIENIYKRNIDCNELSNRIDRNIKLIDLNISKYPDTIKEKIFERLEEYI